MTMISRYECNLCSQVCDVAEMLTTFHRDEHGESLARGDFGGDHHICLDCLAALRRLIPQLSRPDESLSKMTLTSRVRKCMARLHIQTIEELLDKTAEELLACKHFGISSLTRLRDELAHHGLKLRGD